MIIAFQISITDVLGFAIYRKFQYRDSLYYRIIRNNSDNDKNTYHGFKIKQ